MPGRRVDGKAKLQMRGWGRVLAFAQRRPKHSKPRSVPKDGEIVVGEPTWLNADGRDVRQPREHLFGQPLLAGVGRGIDGVGTHWVNCTTASSFASRTAAAKRSDISANGLYEGDFVRAL